MPRRTVPEGPVAHGPAAKGELRRDWRYFAGEASCAATARVGGFRCTSIGRIQLNGDAVAYVMCAVDCARALDARALDCGRATDEIGGANAASCCTGCSAAFVRASSSVASLEMAAVGRGKWFAMAWGPSAVDPVNTVALAPNPISTRNGIRPNALFRRVQAIDAFARSSAYITTKAWTTLATAARMSAMACAK